MRKEEAIKLLGGSVGSAADAIGISYQAVRKWPDVLTPRIADRVYAAQMRIKQAQKRKRIQAVAEAA